MPNITIYVPDELAVEVKKAGVSVSRVCQQALRQEVTMMNATAGTMERIEVDMWDQEDKPYTMGFRGRWLLHPDPDETRTTVEGYDNGAFYGVALTAKGKIAVYEAHCNDRYSPTLEVYDDLNDAGNDLNDAGIANVPPDLLAAAAASMGGVWELDI